MGGCLPRAWRSASVAPLSSRYSDLRTHAIPAGVTARRSPRLVCAFLIVIFIILLSQQLFFCSKQRVLTIKVQFASTLAVEKHEDSYHENKSTIIWKNVNTEVDAAHSIFLKKRRAPISKNYRNSNMF